MKPALILFTIVLSVSCSTVKEDATSSTGSNPTTSIVLPETPVEGVSFDHDLTQQEVAMLSAEYFKRFVSGCGMPDTPELEDDSWSVQLWGGYAGSDYGHFLISKDGRRVTLEPPRSGLTRSTRTLLTHFGVLSE
jgi:hypothetical protein